MKYLIRQGCFLSRQGVRPWPAVTGMLAACAGSAGWGAEPTPIAGAVEFDSFLRHEPTGHYRLTGDIYLSESFSPWTPIDWFGGTLDGAGHSIYGLNIQERRTNSRSGLVSLPVR